MRRFYNVALALATTLAAGAQVPLSYSVENTGADYPDPVLPSGGMSKAVSNLPSPFEFSDGNSKVENFCQWSQRRNEIKREIEHYEIGEKPKFDKLEASYNGGTLTVKISVGSRSLTLTSKISVPSGSDPHPVVIGMDGNTGSLSSSYFSKCIQVPFTHSQISEYSSGFGGGSKSQNDPFFKLYPEEWSKGTGDYCTWSWGISRLIDGLEIVKDQINADLGHIAVTGCSYAGKMALFAGAFDERVALTIAQESGGGGINPWRVSSSIGTNVEGISNTNYDWFKQSFKNTFQSNVGKIPYDHHELIAMIAPRAFLAFGNPDYEWLGDGAGIVGCEAAFEVWKAMGIEDRFGYVIEGGHSHCQASSKQNSAAQAFINKFLYGDNNQNTNIRTSTVKGDSKWYKDWANYKIDMSDTECGNGGSSEPDPEFEFTGMDGVETLCAGKTNEISWNMSGETTKTFSLVWNSSKGGERIVPVSAVASSEYEYSGGYPSPRVAKNALVDDGKRWGAADGKYNDSWLEVTLDAPQLVGGIQIDEYDKYGVVSSFDVQCDVNGKWETVYSGTSIGTKFETSFTPTVTSKLRLYIHTAESVNINYFFPTGTTPVELLSDISASGTYKWEIPADMDEAGFFSINKSEKKVLASSEVFAVEKCVDMSNDEARVSDYVTIAPNPADNMVEIMTLDGVENVVLTDAMGRVVMNSSSNVIETSTLANGVYFAKITTTRGNIVVEKISVRH